MDQLLSVPNNCLYVFALLCGTSNSNSRKPVDVMEEVSG